MYVGTGLDNNKVHSTGKTVHLEGLKMQDCRMPSAPGVWKE